jgi:hypothetical protein
VFEAWVIRLHGEFIESNVIPIWVPCSIARHAHTIGTLAEVRGVIRWLGPQLQKRARQEAAERAQVLENLLGPGARRRRARLAALAWAKAIETQKPVQQGLFEHRALRESSGRRRPESTETRALAISTVPPVGGDPGEFRVAGEPLLVSILAVLDEAARR